MRRLIASPSGTQRARPRRRGIGLGLAGLVLLGVFGVSGSATAHANLDDGGGGYCSPEFDRCDGTGWHDCYDFGFCGGGGGGGGGGGEGGGGGGWEPPVEWVARFWAGTTFREWTSSPLITPYSSCNTGWQEASWIDAWVRRIMSGRAVRNVQHRSVCVRVPSADSCNQWFCWAPRPYAWDFHTEWHWEELV